MAVGRYKDNVYIVSETHGFIRWLFLSIALHLIPAIVIFIFTSSPKKVLYSPIYEVTLLPGYEAIKPEQTRTVEPPRKEEVAQREEPKMEINKTVKGRVFREKHAKPKKSRAAVAPESREKSTRPENAVERIREKVSAEEAIEGIRKRLYKEKVTASGGGMKIASKIPSKVYHYEELDADFRAYFGKISQLIAEAWYLPVELRNKGLKTELSIHIRRDGTVESLWIEKGSGNKLFDESTLRAINKVSPLPPLPKGWKDEAIDLGVRF